MKPVHPRLLVTVVTCFFLMISIPIMAQDESGNDSTPSPYRLSNEDVSFGRINQDNAVELETRNSLQPTVDLSVTSDLLPGRIPQSGQITALVVLDGAPALLRVPQAQTDPRGLSSESVALQVQQATLQVQAEQNLVIQTLNTLQSINIIGNIRYTANAIAVTMDASQIEEVESIPGVARVVPDQIGYLTNANSVPLINAVQAWENTTGFTGQGISIGIIDSGIDYTHANFGGSGDVGRYTGSDTADISDINYDGSKVVSGYDFVGDGWTSGTPIGAGASIPGTAWTFAAGDNDPLDCNGHGSHVAGTAAGFGVDGVGNTFTGPWDSTVPFDEMAIGPGVAPEADLYAFKIGDCSPAVSFVAASLAVDVAMDPNGDLDTSDHLDVINNSYGGAYGSQLEDLAAQMNIAASVGVVVVVAAGNDGDTYFVNGAPSNAEGAISVASSVSDTLYGGLEITSGDGSYPSYPTVIAANPSSGGAPGSVGPVPLRMVAATGGGNSQGCNVADYAGFSGEAGLIVWDATTSGCGSATRMTNAVDATGVAGLVVVSANPADFPFINLACTYGAGPSSIPCVSITNDDGQNLAANPSAFTVRFDSSLQASLSTSLADMVSSFSSRGPAIRGGSEQVIMKPDITAPGDYIVSTGVGTGNEAAPSGGTSMASPHIAGAAALLTQRFPTWDSSEIKALLMNTATHDLWTEPDQSGENYGVSRVGAGRVDILNAFNSQVIAYSTANPEAVNVSFGLVEVIDSESISQTITVENKGTAPQTYDLTFQTMNVTPGVNFSVSPSRISVAAGASATVTVTLAANEAGMDDVNIPDPTTPTIQNGTFGPLPRQRIMEAGGYVVLTPITSTSTLRVPVHAMPRPASDMQAESSVVIGQGNVGMANLTVTGNDVETGNDLPLDVISMMTPFQLVYSHPETLPAELDSGDIQYIGVTSDYQEQLSIYGNPSDAIDNTTIYFAIVTYGDWSTANGFDTWFDVGIDIDENETYDATLFNFETGFLANSDFTDTIMSWLAIGDSWLIGSGTPVGASFINELPPSVVELYAYNNNVIVMPVFAPNIGLNAANTDFQFDVLALSSFFFADWLPDTPPFWIPYDVTTDPYSFNDAGGFYGGPYSGIPLWNDLDEYVLPVTYDVTGLTEPLPNILLLHHHNAKDATVGRAEVVSVERTDELDGAMLKAVDNDAPTTGDTVTFTISVVSNGPGPVDDPIIEDLLPNGLTYVSDTCPGVSSTSAVAGGTSITCDLTGFSIPVSFEMFYEVVATVDAGTSGQTLTNVASLIDINAAMTDTDEGNDTASVNVCVDGAAGACNPAPSIATVIDNNGNTVTPGGEVPEDITSFNIQFSQAVLGGTGPDGAGNEDNYRLLAPGNVDGFQTDSCAVVISPDDTELTFDVDYDTATFTTLLTITGPTGIPPITEGQYRLMVCGSTSIISSNGLVLDGNGDGTGGDDFIADFSINYLATGGSGSGDGSGDGSNITGATPEELGITELPATGETPWWRYILVSILGMGAGIMIFVRLAQRQSLKQ